MKFMKRSPPAARTLALSISCYLLLCDPILQFMVGAVVVNLNNAGASPAHQSVISCLARHQAEEQTLGGYQAAAQARDRLQAVYKKAAQLVRAKEEEIALVESATVGWTRLFYAFCAAKDRQGAAADDNKKKIILVSEAEYAANLVAAVQWARSNENWSVVTIPSKVDDKTSKSTGKVDLTVLEKMLQGTYQYSSNADDFSLLDPSSIALICITHIPTNSGIVNPAQEIGEMIAEHNHKCQETSSSSSKTLPSILYLLDSCQSIGQMPVHVPEIQCHGLVATGRKYLRGPRGTGFMYIHGSLLTDPIHLQPHHVDHFGLPVQRVPDRSDILKPVEEFLEIAPLPSAKRFEFWESNIAGRLGLGEALQHALDRGMEKTQRDILERAKHLYKGLERIQDIELYYPPECGICTFALKNGRDPARVKDQLWERSEHDRAQFEVSVVPATSTPLDSAQRGAPNLLRASVSYTNKVEELDLFCQRLARILGEEAKL